MFLCVIVPANARDKDLFVQWPDLKAYVNGMKISTTLADGAHIEARAIAVEPDGLSVIVRKSSGRAYTSGSSLLPRTSLSTIRVQRTGWKWKVICPVMGFFGMGVLGGVVGGRVDRGGFIISNGAAAGIFAGMATGITCGLLVGRQADHHYTTIKIGQ
jgi:hypothetical protein